MNTVKNPIIINDEEFGLINRNDPRIKNREAAKRQQALISNADKITRGKHNGSKKRKTLIFLSHRLNNQVKAFMSGYNG